MNTQPSRSYPIVRAHAHRFRRPHFGSDRDTTNRYLVDLLNIDSMPLGFLFDIVVQPVESPPVSPRWPSAITDIGYILKGDHRTAVLADFSNQLVVDPVEHLSESAFFFLANCLYDFVGRLGLTLLEIPTQCSYSRRQGSNSFAVQNVLIGVTPTIFTLRSTPRTVLFSAVACFAVSGSTSHLVRDVKLLVTVVSV